MKIKAFCGVRPPAELASEVASRPYDVLNSAEAKAEAGEKSLLHIIKPEIDFTPIADEHSDEAYQKAVDNYALWKANGWLVREQKPNYYIYAQTMDGRTQYGLVACCHFEDYLSGAIKKHELTRPDKEEDRMIHVRNQNANIEPVFFSYHPNKRMDEIVSEIIKGTPEYDFVAEDGFGHTLWLVDCQETINEITTIFEGIDSLYVADGHHRTAAAARVAMEKRDNNPTHSGNEEYCYFLSVIFPDDQLHIIDYNRVVKDLNGLSTEEFLSKMQEDFELEKIGAEIYKPNALHNFGLYVDGAWYSFTAKEGRFNDADPIGVLDVTILSDLVLDKILGIKDLRRDTRVEFVGGIRGLGELQERVDSGSMAVAFAMFPVSMKQLTDIADSGEIMPPKTTWFEPKLRSGLVIHELD